MDKLRRPLALANVVGIFAVGGLPNSSHQAQPMPNVGYNSNKIWVEPDQMPSAMAEAQAMKRSNATEARVLVPITKGGGDILHDLDRYCTALYVTDSNNLKLRFGLDFYGPDRKSHKVKLGAYFPSRFGELQVPLK